MNESGKIYVGSALNHHQVVQTL